jgi:hypothetical protein
MGDDAQLLAGATLAALNKPDTYTAINSALNDALDFSFANDPIWGTPKPDPIFLRNISTNLDDKRRPIKRRAVRAASANK